MAFPRFIDGPWNLLKDKINAIGDYFEAAVATMVGRVKKSITTDTDGKAQLVNDLADSELLPDLVYGVDSNGVRGFKPDPVISETEISSGLDANKPAAGNANRLYYATDTKKLYRDTGEIWEEIARGETVTRLAQLSERAHASLTGIGANDHHAKVHGIDTAADHNGAAGAVLDNFASFNAAGLPKNSGKKAADFAQWGGLLLPYSLVAGGFSGNIHFQVVASNNADFTSPTSLDTATSQTNWKIFSGLTWDTFPSGGMPSTFESACYIGTALDGFTYLRWRAYQGTVYGDWISGVGKIAISGKFPANANYRTLVILSADVANSGDNAIADVTGLSFPVTAGRIYRFSALITYTAAAATTGSRWSISGPASPTYLAYTSRYTLSATTQTINFAGAYDIPAASNADSIAAGSIAIIEGVIIPSADGTVIVRFASEVNGSAITAKAGSSIEYF